MKTVMDPVEVVLVALFLGGGTLLFRWAHPAVGGRREAPPWLREALEWVPVAAMAAMVAPALLPTTALRAVYPGVLAAVVTGGVAGRTRNLLASVVAGMLTFWSLKALG